MKPFLLSVIATTFYLSAFSQKLTTGTYIFDYCDMEYNKCISKCKVVIKGDSITVYATKELAKDVTLVKEGDIIKQGIIVKHQSGKWIIGQTSADVNAKENTEEGPLPYLDFKKKRFWIF